MYSKSLFYSLLLVILTFAFLPSDIFPKIFYDINPNLKHIFAFFILSSFIYLFREWNIIIILIFVISFGLTIEVFQGLFTTREFSVYDLIFNLIGFVVFLFMLQVKNLWFR